MRWAQRQRLNFIGARLLSNLPVNRRHLIERFGVSVPQASIDFRRFNQSHPGAMRYDATLKTYVAHHLTVRAKRYDPRCADLAEAFLQDEPNLWNQRRVEELAQVLQDAAEGWLIAERDSYEPPDPPGWEGGFADNH